MMARDKDGDSLVHMISWLYDLFVIMFSFLTGCFFREVQPRGAWNVPSKGPIILVAAPHANQVRAFNGIVVTYVSSIALIVDDLVR